MKTHITSLLLLVLGLLTSCTTDRLQQAVDQLNAECPMELMEGMCDDITAVTYLPDSNLVHILMVTDDQLGWDTGFYDPQNTPLLRQDMYYLLSFQRMRPLVDAVTSAGASVRLVYRRNHDNAETTVTLTADTLQQILRDNLSDERLNRLCFELSMRMLNGEMPQPMGESLTVQRIDIEGDYLVYHIELDEAHTPMSVFSRYISEREQKRRDTFATDPLTSEFRYLVTLGLGLKQIYAGSRSGQTHEFRLTPEEMAKAFSINN